MNNIERKDDINLKEYHSYKPYTNNDKIEEIEYFSLTPITEGKHQGWDKVTYYVPNNKKSTK